MSHRLLERNIARLCSFTNIVNENSRVSEIINNIRAVARLAADKGEAHVAPCASSIRLLALAFGMTLYELPRRAVHLEIAIYRQ